MKRRILSIGVLMSLAAIALAVDKDLKKAAKDPDSRTRSAAARLLAQDGSPAATKLLVGLIEDRDPYTRDAAVIACNKLKDPKSIALVAKLLKSAEEDVRINAADALARTKSEHALAPPAGVITKGRSSPERVAALDGIWNFKKNARALAIAKLAVDHKFATVRAAAIEAVGRIRGDGDLAMVEKALTDVDAGVRAVARMELRYVDPAAAEKRIGEMVVDKDWRVRAQGVDDARAMRGAASMEALIAFVGDASPRVSEAAHRALVAVSEKGFGRDPSIWKSWWESAKDSWEAPGGRRDDAAPKNDEKGSTSARYHGVPIDSKAIIFVIDASGSMRDSISGVDGGTSRWQKAEAELVKTVKALPDDTKVNVVLFQEETTQAFDAPKALSKKSRKAISTFLKRTSPSHSGNLLAGMETALSQDDADTIFLLTDGAPSAGRTVNKVRVQRAIRSINRRRKFSIHTIGFGAKKKTEQSFMQGVARDAGSVCVLTK